MLRLRTYITWLWGSFLKRLIRIYKCNFHIQHYVHTLGTWAAIYTPNSSCQTQKYNPRRATLWVLVCFQGALPPSGPHPADSTYGLLSVWLLLPCSPLELWISCSGPPQLVTSLSRKHFRAQQGHTSPGNHRVKPLAQSQGRWVMRTKSPVSILYLSLLQAGPCYRLGTLWP